MRLPRQVEDQSVEQQADRLAAERREQAADCAEQGELDPPGTLQQLALGTQRAQQGTLAHALVEGRLETGEEHHEARRENEHQHVLHGQGDLVEDAPQLAQQGVYRQQGDGGEGAGQFDQVAFLAGGR